MWTSTPTPQYGVNPPSDAVRGLGWDTVIDTSAGPTEVTKGGSGPRIHLRAHPLPHLGQRSLRLHQHQSSGSRDPNRVTALQVAESVYAATQTGGK